MSDRAKDDYAQLWLAVAVLMSGADHETGLCNKLQFDRLYEIWNGCIEPREVKPR